MAETVQENRGPSFESVYIKEETICIEDLQETIIIQEDSDGDQVNYNQLENDKTQVLSYDSDNDLTDKYISLCMICNIENIKSSQKTCNRCNKPCIYKCRACKEQINSYDYMVDHLVNDCNLSNHYLCKICSEASNSLTKFLEHVKACKILSETLLIKNESLKKNVKRYCLKCTQVLEAEIKTVIPREKKCQNCQKMMVWLCISCNKKFKTYKGMVYHLNNSCWPASCLKCSKCEFRTNAYQSLISHTKSMHSSKNEKLNECKKCNKQFKNIDLREHIKKCNPHLTLSCIHCPKKFYCKEMFEDHLRKEHGSVKFNFDNNDYLTINDEHVTNSTNTDVVVYLPTFVESFNLKHSKKQKVLNADEKNDIQKCIDSKSKIRRYCLKCKKTYKVEINININSSNEKRCDNCQQIMVWQCNPCNKRFKTYSAVFHHIETYCGYGNLLKCDKCQFKTISIELMKTHLELIHCNRSLNECEKCGEQFMNIDYLNTHLTVCNAKPNVQCKYCSETFYLFNQRELLENHLKMKHGFIEINLVDHFYRLRSSNFINTSNCKRKHDQENSPDSDKRKCEEVISSNESESSGSVIIISPKNLSRNKVSSPPKECFTCTCKSTFGNKEAYDLHLKYCGKKPNIQCEYCPHKWYTKIDLTKHITRVHSDKDNTISNKYKFVETNTAKTIIMNKLSKSKLLRIKDGVEISVFCLTCNQERKTIDRLKKCFECKSALIFCCMKCDSSESCFHLKQYMETLKYECEHCGKGFLTEAGVLYHKMNYHNT